MLGLKMSVRVSSVGICLMPVSKVVAFLAILLQILKQKKRMFHLSQRSASTQMNITSSVFNGLSSNNYIFTKYQQMLRYTPCDVQVG